MYILRHASLVFIITLISLNHTFARVHCDEPYATLAAKKHHYIVNYHEDSVAQTESAQLVSESDNINYEVRITNFFHKDWPTEVIYEVTLKELSTNCETIKVTEKIKLILLNGFQAEIE